MAAQEPFGQVLAGWRARRRLTKQALAEALGFDRSYISHVEAGRHQPSADFARKAEAALNAGGQVWKAWMDATHGPPDTADQARPIPARGTAGLIVEHDHAELRYDGNTYTAAMRRTIVNAGPDPVTRYLIRISVDRHPGDPDASNRLYRAHPLTFDELDLAATCDGEPMKQQIKLDRDSFKEVWLCFENDRYRFPLYPGQRAVLEYSYRVGDDKWGQWFQRAVRLPTLHLSVRLVFPTDLAATVWGTETSTTAEAVPLHTPINQRHDADGHATGPVDVFDWATADPPLNARYRLEWRFRSRDDHERTPRLRLASDRMKAAGITQQGDPILTRVATPFDLPAQAADARALIDELLAAMVRVREHHVFGKGMGLAAPQIGIGRTAAIVQPPGDDATPIVLLNPVVVSESTDTDTQYEGCLSFFDIRGLVPRPLRIEVEHTTPAGERIVTVFTNGLARLVAHEIDHLNGRTYLDRMPAGTQPISVDEYKDTGQAWRYTHS
jgi:peptide deformylase